jgi:two-component system response regulator YcbB
MLDFFIIDDDPVCVRMLEHIIEDCMLGMVVGSHSGGIPAVEEVLSKNPDVVLIDFLMPEIDGIGLIDELKNKGFDGKFIMISQIDNKDMVGEAYKTGIEFFVHKPINSIEVEAVIKKVKEQILLDRSISEIQRSLANLGQLASHSPAERQQHTVKSVVQHILMDMGLLGEGGSKDMMAAMEVLLEGEPIHEFPSLKKLYEMIALKMNPTLTKQELNRETRAIEQRLRRAVLAALTNIASLGLTDYANPKFEHYAPLFFNFQDVRIKMGELENEAEKSRVKVNVKKFLQVLYVETADKLKTK